MKSSMTGWRYLRLHLKHGQRKGKWQIGYENLKLLFPERRYEKV